MGDGYSGIDPARMDEVERQLARAEDALGRNEPQIRRLLDRLNLDTSGLGAMRETRGWIAEKRPDLRRRSELIRAEVAEWGPASTPPDGLSHFNEALYGKTKDPDVYAALVKLGEVSGNGHLDKDALEQLEKRTGDLAFATALANALGATGYRALLAKTVDRPGDKEAARLQAALGKTLGTASGKLSKAWRDGLTADLLAAGPDAHRTGALTGWPEASAIAQALNHGKYATPFLLDVAKKLDTWDREAANHPLGKNPGVMEPLLRALSRNPAAAQDFFSREPTTLKRLLHQRDVGDGGKALGMALEAATLTFRDHDGTPQDPSRGYLSAKLASTLVLLESQRIERDYPAESFLAPASMGRILAGYIGDVGYAADRSRNISVPAVVMTDLPNVPGQEPWGAAFNLKDIRIVMRDAFTDPSAFAPVLAAQTAYAGALLDHGASRLADGRSGNTLDVNARLAGAGFGEIIDAAGLSKIEKGKEVDAATERNMKLLVAAGNTALSFPQTPVWAVTAGISGAWTSIIEDSAPTNAESKARIEANDAVTQTQTVLHDLAARAMLKHGLFGQADPPAPTHPWASLEGLRKGDDPRDSPNNFLKEDGRTLMTIDEMIDKTAVDNTEKYRRVGAYDRWLASELPGALWEKTRGKLDQGFNDHFSKYGS